MSLYSIADLHLSFGTLKPMDVFSGWDNYIEKIKINWKSVIQEGDTVIIAGDVSWGISLEEAQEDFKFINDLPGRKIIIKGNHDYWWSTKNKINKFLEENLLNTISIIFNSTVQVEDICVCGTKGWLDDKIDSQSSKIINRETMRLKRSIELAESLGKEPIVFLHYPPIYCGNECKQILDLLIQKEVKRCFYGHIHGKNSCKKAFNGVYKGIKLQLISCDFLDFMPYLVK